MSDQADAGRRSNDSPAPGGESSDDRPARGWGLWPKSAENRAPDWHELIHYWFVQYNPLYFFSAFCVLGGVYLLALELDGNAVAHGGWSLAQVFLFSVIQTYELLLIAAAGFLVHKIGLMRPAAILTLLEGVFLLDCTFRLETISHLGATGTALSIIWVILVPLKVWLLGRALRIDMPATVIWLVTGAAAGLACMLQTLGMPEVNRAMVILIATWWGAGLFAYTVIAKPRISRSSKADEHSDKMINRIAKSLLIVLGGIYFYHVFNYVAWVGVDDGAVTGPMVGTVFLMIALLRRSEREIWVGTLLALLSSFVFPPSAFAMCVLAAVTLVIRAWQSGKARFLVGAVLSAYLASWTFSWSFGEPSMAPLWSAFLAAGGLAYLAWKLREPTAALALVAGGLGMVLHYDLHPMFLLPQTRLGLGILLVAVGFVALTVGVWVNWWFRSPSRALEPRALDADALDTSEAGA